MNLASHNVFDDGNVVKEFKDLLIHKNAGSQHRFLHVVRTINSPFNDGTIKDYDTALAELTVQMLAVS